MSGQAVLVRDLRHLRDVRDVETGLPMVSMKMARVFGVIAFSKSAGIVVLHELHLDAELRKDGVEHGVGAAVQVVGGDDLVAGLRQR